MLKKKEETKKKEKKKIYKKKWWCTTTTTKVLQEERFKPHGGGIYNVDIYFSFNDLNSFDLITHIILKNCDPISTIYKCPLW